MPDASTLRCKPEALEENREDKNLVLQKWRRMLEQPDFHRILPPYIE